MADDDADLATEDEFDDEDEIELDDDEVIDDDVVIDDEVIDDDEIADPIEVIDDEDAVEDDEDGPGPEVRPKARKGAADDDDDEEEEDDPDDVEADLDTILKDRIAAADEEEEDEDDEVLEVVDASGDGTKIQPRRPGEFLCQSCFLVKAPSQLADAKANLCVDCV